MNAFGNNEEGGFALLVITGSMGSGKTTALAEAADLLSQRNIAHAAIDLDAFAVAHFPTAADNDAMMVRNLRDVVRNCAEAGIRRFMLARAIEDRAQLDLIFNIIPAQQTVVCRLNASIDAMERRVAMREPGMLQDRLVARVAELNRILDRAALEDFTIENEDRPLTEVALEMLCQAGWIAAGNAVPS